LLLHIKRGKKIEDEMTLSKALKRKKGGATHHALAKKLKAMGPWPPETERGRLHQ